MPFFFSNLKSVFHIRILFLISVLITYALFLGPHFIHAQLAGPTNTTGPKMGVKITSPKANQTVPVGTLTIYGTSSDRPDTNCKVFIDWNNTKPMQNVTGIGPGGLDDYSKWTFTYTQGYHLISEGTNELTSKISCYGNLTNNVTTKFYSVNITGSSRFTNSNTPGTYASHMFQPFHSIDNFSKAEDPKSNFYVEISGDYSGNKNNNGDDKIIKFKTSSSMISSKDNKTQDGQNNFDDNHQDLNKVIHDLIKEKLNRISNQFVH